jgi:Holliday junction resolvase RusA-like endonuclease
MEKNRATHMLLVIPGELPGLNEYIHQINRDRHAGNKFKQETQEAIGWQIKPQIFNRCFETPCKVAFRWYSKDSRRDVDNVAAAKKFIFDELVSLGVIKNDTRRWVRGFSDNFEVDPKNPRVEIELTEV